MQITASDAISTISARISCVMRSGIDCRSFPYKVATIPCELSSNPRQSVARDDRKLMGTSSTYTDEMTHMSDNKSVKMPDALFAKKGSRRDFLRNTAATALAGSTLAACAIDDSAAQTTNSRGAADHSGGTMAPNPAPVSAAAAAEAMDRMHEAGVKAFPAKTAGKGNQLMQPRVERGVKIYELTARKIRWETAPGQTVEGWAYIDQIPGPQIRVREGDRVRLILKNELPESTAV